MSQFFASGGQSIGASASASVLPMNIQFIFFRNDWFDLLAVQETLKSLLQHHSLKASILWRSAFFMVQLSHLYMTTGKTTTLTIQTFVGKVMSLLFNTLSRFVIGEGNGTPLQSSCLENPMDRGAWKAAVHGVAEGRTRLNDFTFTFHFHALEKEMATHSSVLAWRILGMGEPGGLLSMGSHSQTRLKRLSSSSSSSFVIAFLPRRKHLLISWLQPPSSVKEIKISHCFHFFPSI